MRALSWEDLKISISNTRLPVPFYHLLSLVYCCFRFECFWWPPTLDGLPATFNRGYHQPPLALPATNALHRYSLWFAATTKWTPFCQHFQAQFFLKKTINFHSDFMWRFFLRLWLSVNYRNVPIGSALPNRSTPQWVCMLSQNSSAPTKKKHRARLIRTLTNLYPNTWFKHGHALLKITTAAKTTCLTFVGLLK